MDSNSKSCFCKQACVCLHAFTLGVLLLLYWLEIFARKKRIVVMAFAVVRAAAVAGVMYTEGNLII